LSSQIKDTLFIHNGFLVKILPQQQSTDPISQYRIDPSQKIGDGVKPVLAIVKQKKCYGLRRRFSC
jgi:hypothetical protein